jgi:hypothetical protein
MCATSIAIRHRSSSSRACGCARGRRFNLDAPLEIPVGVERARCALCAHDLFPQARVQGGELARLPEHLDEDADLRAEDLR